MKALTTQRVFQRLALCTLNHSRTNSLKDVYLISSV